MNRYRFKEIRKELGFSQSDLACRLGYKSRKSVERIESGQTGLKMLVADKMEDLYREFIQKKRS